MQSQNSKLILPLTSVRFFAAIYVVLLHCVAWSHHLETSTWEGRFIRAGYTAVGFFFVLSGYILTHVYLDSTRPFNPRSFWISRFARAYPLLFISLLLDLPHDFLVRYSLHGLAWGMLRSFLAFLSECALLQSWDAYFRNMNAPSWSLSAEGFFYFMFPFVALWIWRRKGVKAFGLFLFFWGCAFLAPVLVTLRFPELFAEVDSSKLQWAVELMPVFRMFEFFAGVALCSMHKSLEVKLTSQQMNRMGYTCIGIASILFVTIIEFSNSIPLLVMSNAVMLPVSALLILGLASIKGWLFRLLSQRHLVVAGESSYAVYLLHAPLWLYFSSIHPITTLGLWAIYLALLLGISTASFFFIERPCRRKILALFSIRPPAMLNQEAAVPRMT